jgi:hypothetical protein
VPVDEPSLYSGGNDDGTFVPFTDILFNALLGFAVMVFIAFALIRPDAKTGTVDVKAEFIITASWPDGNPDDIDLYVEDPQGDIVWYYVKEAGLIHLDRDDRGNYRDTIDVNGTKVENPLNQESVTLRGVIPGEYVVNVYHYTATTGEPVPVSVKVEKINPKLTVVHYGTLILNQKGDEQTAIRFSLDDGGNVVRTNQEFKSLVALAIKPPNARKG